jgi:hypothetical protein
MSSNFSASPNGGSAPFAKRLDVLCNPQEPTVLFRWALQHYCSAYGHDGAARRSCSNPYKPLSLHPPTRQDAERVRDEGDS